MREAITVAEQGEEVHIDRTSKAARIALTLRLFLLAACAVQPPSSGHIQSGSTVANALETSTPVPEPTAWATIFSEATVSMVPPTPTVPLSRPNYADAVSVSPDGRLVVAVNPDRDSITLVDAITLAVLAEIPVGDDPRTLSITPDSKKVLHGSATLSKSTLDGLWRLLNTLLAPYSS
jgi:YVTN family beta-propeller protein